MADEPKSQAEQLKDALFYQTENSGLQMTDAEIEAAFHYCEGYKSFLGRSKTEREAVASAVQAAQKAGFRPFEPGIRYEKGSRVYANNRGKSIVLAVVGERPLREGVRIAAAHIDSPRLDLKQNPLYEDTEIAQFKTHYYGGIKKYQWPTIPLALHGVIFRRDGGKVEVNLGENEGDPLFCITDLLPHLAAEQMKKPMMNAIPAENLNVVVGSLPFRDDKASEMVKLRILQMLHEKYGIVEADFLSAELTMVPAYKPVDIGFDRSFIGAYGHDDKVCAYPALTALLDCGVPPVTGVCVLTDKEEIGSEGNTGLKSAYLPYFVADLAHPWGLEGREVLSRSTCLSADVSAAYDPNYPDVMEKRNAAYVNRGVALNKYTGSRGKYSTNDASAEFTRRVTALLDREKVQWQMAELGRVDAGGGGTVAMYIANLNVDVIDMGVPVLSMHAPFELVSKLDVYSAYRAFDAFFRS